MLPVIQPALLAPALLLAQPSPSPSPCNTHPASLRRPLAVGVGLSLLTCRLRACVHEYGAYNVCQEGR